MLPQLPQKVAPLARRMSVWAACFVAMIFSPLLVNKHDLHEKSLRPNYCPGTFTRISRARLMAFFSPGCPWG